MPLPSGAWPPAADDIATRIAEKTSSQESIGSVGQPAIWVPVESELLFLTR